MMASVTPNDWRGLMVISRRVRPFSATRALGRVPVRGRRRVPKPAARIMAFMAGTSEEWVASGEYPEKTEAEHLPRERRGHREERESFAEVLKAEMAEDYFHAGPGAEAFGELLGKKDGAVLAAGAAEADHQIFEAAGLVGGDGGVDEA